MIVSLSRTVEPHNETARVLTKRAIVVVVVIISIVRFAKRKLFVT